mmetsp:Transcript_125479/g.234668  ORF Transcript_125479/g.234668 Transcript_125479/m.234668 type:complete len:207 (+) Transcript_125479:898-1518(+)
MVRGLGPIDSSGTPTPSSAPVWWRAGMPVSPDWCCIGLPMSETLSSQGSTAAPGRLRLRTTAAPPSQTGESSPWTRVSPGFPLAGPFPGPSEPARDENDCCVPIGVSSMTGSGSELQRSVAWLRGPRPPDDKPPSALGGIGIGPVPSEMGPGGKGANVPQHMHRISCIEHTGHKVNSAKFVCNLNLHLEHSVQRGCSTFFLLCGVE